MSGHSPSFQSLIYSVSTLLAANVDPETSVEAVVELVARHLGSVTVSISLQTSRGRRAAFSERKGPGPLKGGFVFVRKIVVRGASHGCLNVEVDVPKGGASTWLRTLETLTQQLALYTDRQLLEAENECLRKSARALKEELRLEKILARACGIVAISNGMSAEAARQWIVTAARKHGLDIFAVSDQIILHHVAQRQFQLPSSSSGQRGRKDWAAA